MTALVPPTLDDIRAARDRLRGIAVRTPLVRLDFDGGGEVWLKLETLQPGNSFKIRGAWNALAVADPDLLAKGVVTASAGNMAQGLAWSARRLGLSCTVVAPDHAPQTKLAAIERLGAATIRVPFARWWRTLEERRFEGLDGYFVHPAADPNVMAGNGTIALEVLEDLPQVESIVVPYGGGGLSLGIASALRQARPDIRVFAAEPDTAAPLAASLAKGSPQAVEYQASFVDGCGSSSVLAEMWPLARTLLAGGIAVPLSEIAGAVRILAERVRVIAEGAGALPLAAARFVPGRPIVAVISGGNIDTARLIQILQGQVPSVPEARKT